MEPYPDVVGAGRDVRHRVDGIAGVRLVTGDVLEADDRTGVLLVAIGGGNQPDRGDPVGPDNDRWLRKVLPRRARVVCAWGNHGAYLGRGKKVSGDD